MAHYWLIVMLSWTGSVSLQYISNAGPADNNVLSSLEPAFNLPPNGDYVQETPTSSKVDSFNQNEQPMFDVIFPNIFLTPPSPRQRRTPAVEDTVVRDSRYASRADTDRTANSEPISTPPYVMQRYERYTGNVVNNASGTNDATERKTKRSFSPWGGKRNTASDAQNNMWTWKRSLTMREPSMPKRVRFSPWGGKRSSHLIYKPGTKASKIIFSGSLPELTRLLSQYPPSNSRFNLAGIRLVAGVDKRNPIRILALTSNLDDRTIFESARMYKPGNPFISLKKNGKRKVKFSTWGGKRSPPIIGPIWKHPVQTVKDQVLDTILLIGKAKDDDVKTTTTL